ncbi:hypothetical protein TNCV_2901391 [Trichonephila clavipes]|nr:hypothetical protein TNCV_2901391 [Trichonephila clavipes]
MSSCGRDHERDADQPESQTCSIDDISDEQAGQGRSCMCWAEQKSQTVFATLNKFTVHIISLQISEKENNSSTHVDKLTLFCLRHFHKINELPSKTTPPENDFPYPAFSQLASEN